MLIVGLVFGASVMFNLLLRGKRKQTNKNTSGQKHLNDNSNNSSSVEIVIYTLCSFYPFHKCSAYSSTALLSPRVSGFTLLVPCKRIPLHLVLCPQFSGPLLSYHDCVQHHVRAINISFYKNNYLLLPSV